MDEAKKKMTRGRGKIDSCDTSPFFLVSFICTYFHSRPVFTPKSSLSDSRLNSLSRKEFCCCCDDGNTAWVIVERQLILLLLLLLTVQPLCASLADPTKYYVSYLIYKLMYKYKLFGNFFVFYYHTQTVEYTLYIPQHYLVVR